MGKQSAEEEVIKKGPWTAEEDEVLLNFVKKNGPRDWSSIRSMGLLPRTGKSCRLRWVNKLRPNLKKGCKFSAEEERMVLEMQARFGNKWATIASYLPGRTDNDVKNFWSTRQKRLARILKTSAQASRSKKNKGKVFVEDEAPLSLAPKSSCSSLKEEPKLKFQPPQVSIHPNINPSIQITTTAESPFQWCFTDLPQTIFPESCDLCLELGESNFNMDVFSSQEVFEVGNVSELCPDLAFDDLEDGNEIDGNGDKDYKLPSPTKTFSDFPVDLLDFLEAIPKLSTK